MNKSLFVFLAALSTFSEAELLIYRYDVTINDAFGSLDANTVLTGEFTFDSEQSGTDINGVSNAKRFELSTLSLSDGNESIELSFVPGNDGWMVVGDDSPALSGEDFFTVRAEGNPAFTGTLGGLAVDTLYLVWTDTDGSANNGFALPLDETTFNEYENATIQLQAPSGGTLSLGDITNVADVSTLDSNGDGILDVDAIALGLDPNDPDGDTDNDGLSDIDEVGDIEAPMDNDGDGVIDALEPGPDASSAEIASGLLLESGDTITIKTEPGEMLSQVSATEATDSPGGIKFPYGMVSYITTAPIGGSVTVRITFSVNLPDNLVIEKVDRANNYTPLPKTVWNQVGNRSVDITLTDGDPQTDLDGIADGSIDDPVAVGNNTSGSDVVSDGGGGGSGGCTIGPTSNVDPVWLFILFVSGVGCLRRHRIDFMELSTKKAV